MAEQEQQNIPASATGGAYGYASDEVKISPFVFGGNFGKTFLKTFGWIPNGGQAGAEQEALDIVFEINGVEKSYRKFPVVKAFGKNNEEITDPNAPEFKEALQDFNAVTTHILHAFHDSDTIRAGFSVPITSFKQFCEIATSLLPKNFAEQPLDIFLQWQWQIDQGQTRTFLEIPKKMKYGKWLSPALPGNWKEQKVENPDDRVQEALFYVNDEGQKHPFIKNGWFMNSNFANQQKTGDDNSSSTGAAAGNSGAAAASTQADGAAKASTW